jgi:hypothetical protein
MAFDRDHVRITIRHGIHLTDEIGETHISLADITNNPIHRPEAVLLTAAANEVADDIESAWITCWTDSHLLKADYSEVKMVKLAAIARNGRYVRVGGVMVEPYAVEYSGTFGTSPNVLPQASVVAGLRTDKGSGRKGRGARLFLPHTSLSLESGTASGSTTAATGVATAVSNFVKAINAMDTFSEANYQVVAMGTLPTAPSSDTFGPTLVCAEVVSARVGRIVDTQQRRRRSLEENYVSVSTL